MGVGDFFTGEQSWGKAATGKAPQQAASTGVMRPASLGGFYRDFNHMPGATTYAESGPTNDTSPREGGAAGTATGPPMPSPVATPVSAVPNFANEAVPSMKDVLFGQMLGIQGQYQWGADMATADNALNQQMLGLKKQGLGIDAQGINTDRQSVDIKRRANETDSEFLRRQRAMYDDQLANQLAGIDTKLGVDKLDHENQYISGGAMFAPGQKYRRDAMLQSAEQDRLNARLSTAMSQLGVDRTLAGNDAQNQEYDLDMNRLDQRMAQNGINLQMLGLNGQQLTLALQKHLGDLGISSMVDAQKLLSEAATGNGDAADYARQLLVEWLQGGGQGQLGPVGMGG